MKLKRKRNVLIVEDNVALRETATSIMENWEFNVLVAGDGNEAIDVATDNKLDLVILDIKIPKINGYEVCKILKNNPGTEKVPVILLTGMTKMDAVDRGFQCGADAYLIKPVNWDRLRREINRVLKGKI
ncbi:PleD family two-component system response regulator [Elusimicrobiota bacterium]